MSFTVAMEALPAANSLLFQSEPFTQSYCREDDAGCAISPWRSSAIVAFMPRQELLSTTQAHSWG
ncbi:hypothetical protein ColTof4_07309 [Colletotrichum tofieldiae]|nr:hypothetical protein ColTof3_12251 [Colletotrichum tofieldiae]GKT74886.1 hypothetical protein ColTof4_07309 [Colletotrichum tofieldiae]